MARNGTVWWWWHNSKNKCRASLHFHQHLLPFFLGLFCLGRKQTRLQESSEAARSSGGSTPRAQGPQRDSAARRKQENKKGEEGGKKNRNTKSDVRVKNTQVRWKKENTKQAKKKQKASGEKQHKTSGETQRGKNQKWGEKEGRNIKVQWQLSKIGTPWSVSANETNFGLDGVISRQRKEHLHGALAMPNPCEQDVSTIGKNQKKSEKQWLKINFLRLPFSLLRTAIHLIS